VWETLALTPLRDYPWLWIPTRDKTKRPHPARAAVAAISG
jgi:hypothetical protein